MFGTCLLIGMFLDASSEEQKMFHVCLVQLLSHSPHGLVCHPRQAARTGPLRKQQITPPDHYVVLVMIIYIILEAHAWYSICIATDNCCQTDIVGGFGCNENNCARIDTNQNQWRPLLPPPPLPPLLGKKTFNAI
jgi:hypothetical protein